MKNTEFLSSPGAAGTPMEPTELAADVGKAHQTEEQLNRGAATRVQLLLQRLEEASCRAAGTARLRNAVAAP